MRYAMACAQATFNAYGDSRLLSVEGNDRDGYRITYLAKGYADTVQVKCRFVV